MKRVKNNYSPYGWEYAGDEQLTQELNSLEPVVEANKTDIASMKLEVDKVPAIETKNNNQEIYINNLQGDVNKLKYPSLYDHSVNRAYGKKNAEGKIDLICEPFTGNVAGNFNGGGTGNKAMLGLPAYNSMALGALSSLEMNYHLFAGIEYDTVFQWQVDLANDGNFKVFLIGGFTNAAAESTADQTTDGVGNYRLAWDKNIHNVLVVGGVTGVEPKVKATATSTAWWELAYSIADILAVYPNAIIKKGVNLDGGLPAKEYMSAIWLQKGGSGTTTREHSRISDVKINGSIVNF